MSTIQAKKRNNKIVRMIPLLTMFPAATIALVWLQNTYPGLGAFGLVSISLTLGFISSLVVGGVCVSVKNAWGR